MFSRLRGRRSLRLTALCNRGVAQRPQTPSLTALCNRGVAQRPQTPSLTALCNRGVARRPQTPSLTALCSQVSRPAAGGPSLLFTSEKGAAGQASGGFTASHCRALDGQLGE